MSQQKEIGTLVVVVLKAQHLHQPSFYKQSPYVQTFLSGVTKQTKVDPKGGQHPVWDDELRFPVLADVGKDNMNRILEISCYKDEQRGDDILLGKGTVNIEETLKTGEFDDWVPLETSAGARGEVYLEMTFYANSPPPLTRRPSKLNPSDRLARPAAYYDPSKQSTPKSTSLNVPSHPEASPAARERKSSQIPPTGGSQIPSSLIPARGIKNQTSRQASPNGGTTPVVAVKSRRDSLPPLPIENGPADVGSGKETRLPASLHPGWRSVPRPMPPQGRNQVLNTGRPPPEVLPDRRHRTLSDTPLHVAPPPPFSHLRAPVQSHAPEVTLTAGARVDSTPSFYVEEHVQEHPLFSPPTQEREPRGAPTVGDHDSFSNGPGAVYVQPDSQPYIAVAMEGSPKMVSPSPRPMPLQSSLALPGRPSSHYQQYIQYPSGSPTPLPLSPPQVYPQLQNTQFQQQQLSHSPQPQHLPYQQLYVPPQQQQYLPSPQQQYTQPPCYAQTSYPPQLPQSYQQHQHPSLPPGDRSPVASQEQLPLYTQPAPQPQQSYFTIPPPPPSVLLQTPQPNFHQLSHQPRSDLSPPPPPPPPPLLYNQGGNGSSTPVPEQPPQTSVRPSAPSQEPVSSPTPSRQGVTPIISPLRSPLPSQVVPIITPASNTEEAVGRRQVEEGLNKTEPVVVAEVESVLQEDTLEDAGKHQMTEERIMKAVEDEQGQLERLEDPRGKGMGEGKGFKGEDRQQREEELQKQEALKKEEYLKQQEVERQRWEEERKRQEEEQRKREEEYKRWEEERRRREDDEKRRREEELRKRKEEERRVREEEHRRREEERRKWEEERKREEEEHRRREEEEHKRREEEEHRRREEERRGREEEECRRREEERRRQMEEQIQRDRVEERRRKTAKEQARRRRAEEEEAERKWQEELTRIRARAEQEAADAAFARAQWEADEEERRRQEEADLALVRQAQEEIEREDRVALDRRRQEEADMEVARREQAHEQELERRRQEERRKRMEEVDRELARKLDMELNLNTETPSRNGD